MARKKTPPEYGDSPCASQYACLWRISSAEAHQPGAARTSRQQFILVPGRDAGGGLAGRQSGWGSAYRSHDGCLPVKLSQGQPSRTTRRRRDLDGRDTRLGDPVRGCRSVARSSPGVDIPDPRQRVQRSGQLTLSCKESVHREGISAESWGCCGHERRSSLEAIPEKRPRSHSAPPHTWAANALTRHLGGRGSHRPRSVSSLLMRLRAISVVCV